MKKTGVILIALVALICCEARLAQGEEKSPESITINLDGVKVSEFVSFFNSATSGKSRAICTKAAADVELPKIEGLTCSPRAAIRLLEVVTQNTRDPLVISEDLTHESGKDAGLIFVIDSHVPPTTKTVVNVDGALLSLMNKNGLDLGDPIKDRNEGARILEETLEFGLKTNFSDDPSSIKMKYHVESGLLFLDGPEEQVSFVKEMIVELE